MYVRCSENSKNQETKENKMSTESTELKPWTAEQYRELVAQQKAKQPTEIVTLQSGSVFELRRIDIQERLLVGQMPQSLIGVGFRAWQGKNSGDLTAVASLDGQEATDMLIFMRAVVCDATVKPKIVEVASNAGEISAAEVLPEDFSEIFAWAMSGTLEEAPAVN